MKDIDPHIHSRRPFWISAGVTAAIIGVLWRFGYLT